MPTDRPDQPHLPESQQPATRTPEEVFRQFVAHREELRGVVKEMEQEVSNSQQGRSDTEGE